MDIFSQNEVVYDYESGLHTKLVFLLSVDMRPRPESRELATAYGMVTGILVYDDGMGESLDLIDNPSSKSFICLHFRRTWQINFPENRY